MTTHLRIILISALTDLQGSLLPAVLFTLVTILKFRHTGVKAVIPFITLWVRGMAGRH